MKNKKGLTLVELLAVVVILGIIALVTLSVVSNVISKQKEKTYYSQLNQLILSGQNWAIDNPRKFLADNCNSENKNYQKLTLETLQNEGYLSDKFVDTTSNNNLNFSNENTFVYVYKLGKGYLYCVESPKCNKPKYKENTNTASNICCNGSEIKQMLEAENCQVPDPSNTDPNDPNQNTDPNGPSVEIASVASYTNTITVTYTLTNVDEGYDGYLVTYWKDNENVDAHTSATINTTACSATSCTITGLTPATKYNIRVYAKKTGFTSAYKNTAATTQASSGGSGGNSNTTTYTIICTYNSGISGNSNPWTLTPTISSIGGTWDDSGSKVTQSEAEAACSQGSVTYQYGYQVICGSQSEPDGTVESTHPAQTITVGVGSTQTVNYSAGPTNSETDICSQWNQSPARRPYINATTFQYTTSITK